MNDVIADSEVYHRPIGQLLQPDRGSMEALDEIALAGTRELAGRIP